jgi:hypothetical protein
MPEVEVPRRRCPGCGHAHDRATDIHDSAAQPKPGDWTVCLNCALTLKFGPGLTLRTVTSAEVITAPKEEQRDLALATRAILALKYRRRLQ